MSEHNKTVVGIDVGGKVKGFHAVALRGETFVDKATAANPALIVDWCLDHRAAVVSVDAPCGWSQTGLSRLAERELLGKKIHCFATPTRERAENHDKGFYDWVFNGENLYMQLRRHYPLFDGRKRKGTVCFETFPHAIVCAMKGRLVSWKSKVKVRREALETIGYDISNLSNIDFVDAALCAVVADAFSKGSYKVYGDSAEGFIVVPDPVRA
ncbi:MAG: DUF429 domain-containing protein [Thermodesulfobacteriota bacterium]|nr:DUF429 domain-containing protein [Thermodesulfobacteriota bacterium]